MLPIEQTRLSPQEGGNCYAACFASILECPLADVPQLAPGEGLGDDWADYHERLRSWLEARNLIALTFPFQENGWRPQGYSILGAKSVRFPEYTHAVVALNGEIVWDPHPMREQGVGAWVDWTIFQVIDPAIARARI